MSIEIIDNAVSVEIQTALEELCLSVYFPWHYHNTSAYLPEFAIPEIYKHNAVDTPFMSHLLWDNVQNSSFFDQFRPIVEAIPRVETTQLARFKLNLTFPDMRVNKDTHSYPHTDADSLVDYITAIYYTNDSTGDTVFFNDDYTVRQRIQPKRGRLVVFDGKILHAGNNPACGARVVANINLIPRSNDVS